MRHLRTRGGFTLVELLLTTAIIGTLAAGSAVSYAGVRSRTRDTERLTEAKQVQAALALHLDVRGGFPGDGQFGPAGIRLGEGQYLSLSEAGFGRESLGEIFISPVPQNPVPNGVSYVYRSLNDDGTDCDQPLCPSYALLFGQERGIEGLAAGVHAIDRHGIREPLGFLPADMAWSTGGGEGDPLAKFDVIVGDAARAVAETVGDPDVQKANERVVAPTVATATAVNTAFASSQFGQYLLLFLTQPAALFGMRRRKHWGTVYSTSTHMPVDLAVVRLREYESRRVVKSAVTDAEGRYSFLVPAGRYVIDAAKAGFTFPSALSRELREDGPYGDLYRGDVLEVPRGGGVLTPNVPVDPVGTQLPDAAVVKAADRRRWHRSLAVASPVLGAIVFAMRPTPFVGLLFAAEVLLYLLFRRLANPSEPRNWGTVYDRKTRKPVARAVVRIFSARYNKLLEAQVTDAYGRYHFRVMADTFYLTVSRDGYRKTETEPFDLTDAKTPVVVASNLPLARLDDAQPAVPPTVGGASPAKPSVLIPPPAARPVRTTRPGEVPQLPEELSDKA